MIFCQQALSGKEAEKEANLKEAILVISFSLKYKYIDLFVVSNSKHFCIFVLLHQVSSISEGRR
jgi:hypothetical protein